MNKLPEDILNTIYKYKHQIEFIKVMNELNYIVKFWCDEQLTFIYCKSRHERIHKRIRNEFKCLNVHEEHLNVYLKCKDILDIINGIELNITPCLDQTQIIFGIH